ncbi:MAG: hypothetical protein ACTSUE_26380 [Promethearchaeota archaeon]
MSATTKTPNNTPQFKPIKLEYEMTPPEFVTPTKDKTAAATLVSPPAIPRSILTRFISLEEHQDEDTDGLEDDTHL